ncbi:MAG: carbohydrate kinase family protein [Candidatus Asgardarchaeia archaeon]
MRVDVTILGDINVDMITHPIVEYPEKGKQITVPFIYSSTGGCACNTAIACARLGLKVRLIGKVGDDIFGKYLLKLLKKVGIVSKVRTVRGGHTGITFAIAFKDMSRSFITYKGTNDTLCSDDFRKEEIKGSVFVITGFNLLNSLRKDVSLLFEYAHSRGMKTVLDPNWDPEGWPEKRVRELYNILKVTDWFFPNVEEARAITYTKVERLMVRKLLMLGPKIVCLKMGEKGCLLGDESGIELIPPFRVASINTTGAGDVFLAAFIKYYLMGKPLSQTVRFASAAGALSTTKMGLERYPTYEDVMNFMEART